MLNETVNKWQEHLNNVGVLARKEKIEELLEALKERGDKSSIRRTTNMFQDYGVDKTKMFVKVRNGHSVEYFGNPFHNLYRIDSRVGTNDFVTHSVRR